jgi:hypothetical protein
LVQAAKIEAEPGRLADRVAAARAEIRRQMSAGTLHREGGMRPAVRPLRRLELFLRIDRIRPAIATAIMRLRRSRAVYGLLARSPHIHARAVKVYRWLLNRL